MKRLLLLSLILLFTNCLTTGTDHASSGSGSEIVGNVQTEETKSAKKIAAKALIPVPEAFIYVYSSISLDTIWNNFPLHVRVKADQNGNFRIINIPLGQYTIRATDGTNKSAYTKVLVTARNQVYHIGSLILK
jgi:hypothetical protein